MSATYSTSSGIDHGRGQYHLRQQMDQFNLCRQQDIWIHLLTQMVLTFFVAGHVKLFVGLLSFPLSHVSMSVEELLKRTDSAPMADDSREPPDEVLVVAAIVGDLDAFNQLVVRYRAAVIRVAAGIVGREHAEDIAQDAWLLAFKALPSIEEPRKFAAWLSAITRHRARRVGQKENRHQTQRVAFDEVLIEKLAALSPPLTEAIQDEELKAALDNVSSDYALVLKLRFLDEMPLNRIAAFLGTPLSTVKWRLHQGKKLLRAQLADQRELIGRKE